MSNHEREGSRSPDGDAALDRAWHQLSDEQPPPSLDAAIIAAAHKSIQGRDDRAQVIHARPRYRSWLTRWQPLAAAAAVAGLAFVLVQSLPRDRDVAPSTRMEGPATTPAAAQEKPIDLSTREAIKATTVSPPPPSGARESVAAPEMAGRAASAAAAAPVPAQTTAATAAAASDNVAPPDAAERAARVAALYAAGDIAGATDALREFRAADPSADTYLPESLRDWARTVE
jgi:resuscitation-promoting factor RpfA